MPQWIEIKKSDEMRALVPRLNPIARRSLRFLAGDYLQNLECWSGALPPPEDENRVAILREIEQGFVPQPMIGEVHGRHVDGVVGREPAFSFTSALAPDDVKTALDAFDTLKALLIQRRRALAVEADASPQKQGFADARAQLKAEAAMAQMLAALGLPDEDELTADDLEGLPNSWLAAIKRAKEIQAEIALLGEANAAVGAWWDKRRGHETVQEFASQLCAVGSAAMRIWLPRGLLETFTDGATGRPAKRIKAGLTWQQTLDYIYLEVPQPESATVQVDRDTMQAASIFSYTFKDAEGKETQRVELSFLNEDSTTTVRILEDEDVQDEVKYDCGGALFIDQATRAPLITDALQRNQNALNVINSMILRNGNLAGFPEHTYFNAQPPTVEVAVAAAPEEVGLDEQTPDEAPQKTVRVPVEMEVGPGVRNFVTGIVTTDDNGTETITKAEMHVREPVSPEPLIAAAERFEMNIYEATSQSHIKISSDATASAVSRVQARADYVRSLLKTASPIEGVLRSRLHAVLCLAAYLAQDKEKLRAFKSFRTSVTCHLDAGPLAPDERRVIVEEYDKGIRSLESTQILLGTEDVDAERALLEKEREGSRAERKARVEELKSLTDAGAGIGAAARVAGFPEDDALLLEKGDFVDPEADDKETAKDAEEREPAEEETTRDGEEDV